VACLRPDEGMSIYDPTCGTGGMLLEAVHYLERQGKNPKALHLYGQEMNLNTWTICKMNLFLHNIDDAFIERGDTLRDPRHLVAEGSKVIKTFDRVLANPPFSLKNWGNEEWKGGDKFGRDTYGCPPKSYGDLAFVQHMAASLKPDGMLGVVLPHGILFRGGAEGKIRKGLLEDDLVEAVIGLAPNIFYGAGIPTCILIINRNKTEAQKGKILFVNGSDEFVQGKKQNFLSEANVERLKKAFIDYTNKERVARVVDLAEIINNNYNLNIARYVDLGKPEEIFNTSDEVQKLQQLLQDRNNAESKMMTVLKELGYGP